MQHGDVSLLDCTLREAPVKNFFIGDRLIREFIHRCENVGLNIIECGFLKDVDYVPGSNCFRTVEQIRSYIPNKRPDITYVALMDYGRYNVNNLSQFDNTSIDGIRICFKYGEQKKAIEVGKKIKEKGYKVFIQHVDTMAYSDVEIIEFIDMVNELMPTGYSIVDTFGSMYEDDLDRLTMLADYHLDPSITLGFHAHNNLMIANSNAQSYILRYAGKRSIIVDASVLGCGRGAGNANTELIAEFLNKKYNKNYDLNELLDLVDSLMPHFQEQCSWGYSIPYFLSGIHGAHVYNANYLLKRHNISSKDLRSIIEKLGVREKKAYDYALLEKLYVEHFDHQIDDHIARAELFERINDRPVLLLAPGKTLKTEKDKIERFIKKEKPVIFGVNDKIVGYCLDYIFFSSVNRYIQYCYKRERSEEKVILTSNILSDSVSDYEFAFNYKTLIKMGWANFDSSMILLLRLLLSMGCKKISLAGFDGFSGDRTDNYYDPALATNVRKDDLALLTKENQEMLTDLSLEYPDSKIRFFTSSLYYVKVCRPYYRAVLFDLDGTLLDTTEGVIAAVRETIESHGLPMPDDATLKTFVGPPMQKTMSTVFGMDGPDALRIANEFRRNYKEYLFNASLYPGVKSLLRSLALNGVKIAVATNKSHDNAMAILKEFDLMEYCDYAQGSDLEGKLSKKDIIDSCIEHLGVNAEEVVFVGDSEFDSTAAEQVGVDFLGVTYGFGFTKATAADFPMADSCKEIEAYIMGERGSAQ